MLDSVDPNAMSDAWTRNLTPVKDAPAAPAPKSMTSAWTRSLQPVGAEAVPAPQDAMSSAWDRALHPAPGSDGTDPAVLAMRRQTEAIRQSITAMHRSTLEARLQAAEQARSAVDTVFRLTSGEGQIAAGTTREEDNGQTLLSRVKLTPASSSSRNRVSGAVPTAATAPASAIGTAAPSAGAIVQARTFVANTSYRVNNRQQAT